METQADARVDTRDESKSRLLLRILRNPFASLLVLHNLVLYVHWSGNAYLLTFPSGLGVLLFLPSGLFTGALVIANLMLLYLSYAYFVERRQVSELAVPHMVRELGIGLLLGFGLFTTCVVIAMALGLYRIEGVDRWQNLVAGVTGGAFTTPFAEELLYRGVWFRILEGVFGSWVALVISSAVFGLMHAGNAGETFAGVASIAIVFGPMLAAPFMVTRRLWMSIGLHGAWNYTMGKIFSGAISGNTTSPGLLKTTFKGPDGLTGGSAGMEGSSIAILVSLAFTVVMMILAARRGTIVPPSWSLRSARPKH